MIDRFIRLWNDLGAEGSPYIVYEELLKLYASNNRHYHNINHIRDCLKEFDNIKKYSDNPLLLEFSLWTHDIIYDTKPVISKQNIFRLSNEEQSALWGKNALLNAGVPNESTVYVFDRIMMTKHDKEPLTIDDMYIIDIDFAIFGQSEDVFDDYERNIRKEYSHIPLDIYLEKRPAIIKKFFDKPFIYNTIIFREEYEQQARKNLERSIARKGIVE